MDSSSVQSLALLMHFAMSACCLQGRHGRPEAVFGPLGLPRSRALFAGRARLVPAGQFGFLLFGILVNTARRLVAGACFDCK